MNLSVVDVARAALGEPAKASGGELLWLCPIHEDRHPSLQVNERKGAWLCGPCGKGGNAWRLAAFLGNVDPNDKRAVADWLRQRGLLTDNGNSAPKQRAAKPAKEQFQRVAEFYYRPDLRKVRFEAPAADGGKPAKTFRWERREREKWLPGDGGLPRPLYANRLFREQDQVGVALGLEGEAKADLAGELGIPAFSFKHVDAINDLAGADVVLWPDHDKPGITQANEAARVLHESGLLRSIRIVTPPPELPIAGDIVDAVRTLGWTRERIETLMAAAEPYPVEKAIGVLLEDVTEEKVNWLWPNRIPLGALTVLDGDPGNGKSLCALEIAARVSRGRPLPGEREFTAPGGVVILSAEDSLSHVIKPRLRAADADMSRVIALPYSADFQGQATFSRLPNDIPVLGAAIKRVAAKLVVFDVLVAYVPTTLSTKSDQDVRLALAPLAEMADRLEVAVLLIRHLNKAPGGNALYRGGGSIGIIGAARSGLLLAADPQSPDTRVLAVIKSNLGVPAPSLNFRIATADGVPHIEWCGTSTHSAETLLAPPPTAEDKSAVAEAREFLAEELKDGAREAVQMQQAAKRLNISDMTLRRAKGVLGVRSHKQGAQWFWQLPVMERQQ